MEKFKNNNFAYIDGNNFYKGVKNTGWRVDLFRFRKWLSDKYSVTKAYYFIGFIERENNSYTSLRKAGFTVVFKEVVYDGDGKAKGNCDADLVLQSTIDFYESNCDNQIVVTSDGDYSSLVKFLQNKEHLRIILSPSIQAKCSILLKRTGAPITYLTDVKSKIELKRKSPQ